MNIGRAYVADALVSSWRLRVAGRLLVVATGSLWVAKLANGDLAAAISHCGLTLWPTETSVLVAGSRGLGFAAFGIPDRAAGRID